MVIEGRNGWEDGGAELEGPEEEEEEEEKRVVNASTLRH
jgi:hypothetical protein